MNITNGKIIVLLFLVHHSHSYTKVWLYNANISDPLNWVGNKPQKTCPGLTFAPDNSIKAIYIEKIKVKKIILPKFGTIELDSNTKITFDENGKEDYLNCVKLKQFQMESWLDFRAWNNTDDPDNPAIPYIERVPTKFDNIVFPNPKYTFNQISLEDLPQRRSISFDESTEKQLFLRHDDGCMDLTGCFQGVEGINSDKVCEIVDTIKATVDCEKPIRPKGFCNKPKCGGTIIIETVKSGFRLGKLNKKLKEFASYTHASKISSSSSTIQVFFTEKQFTGQSIVDATEVYNVLRKDNSYFCDHIKLQVSGGPLYEQSELTRNALSVTFGTLIAAIIIFGLLFFMFSPTVTNLNIRNRLLGSRPLSTYIMRYDTMEDRSCIVDGQSVAGSVLDLNRAFANPMYEHTQSSTSTSHETIESDKLDHKDIDLDIVEAKEEAIENVIEEVEEEDVFKEF